MLYKGILECRDMKSKKRVIYAVYPTDFLVFLESATFESHVGTTANILKDKISLVPFNL
jgi:hypothetical protein